jgi:formylglycine-generating enzyme required for sulfatase activity
LDNLLKKYLIKNEKDGTLLVLIPEGEFLAGEDKFKVHLPAYYLALYPVTFAQYKRFIDETKYNNWKPPDWNDINWDSNDPVFFAVSWDDAQAYCRWAGLRLPSELEWEKGARGIDGREYPWGNEWDSKKCVNSVDEMWVILGGSRSIFRYSNSLSPWGLSQMAGNVWEWCEDWYDANAYDRYKKGDLVMPSSGSSRVIRGGTMEDRNPDSFCCAFRNYRRLDSYRLDCGFRCAKSV